MTVVDVNTGKFTGSGGNLEETVTKNNLEAAEEVVRQLRLRDIGGIIVIDFIDMVLESNRDLVLRRMVECLGRDRTKHQVAEVTSLGLVQMTRKRMGTGLLEVFGEQCETCAGRGIVTHDDPVEHRRANTVAAEHHVQRVDSRPEAQRTDSVRTDSQRPDSQPGGRTDRKRRRGRAASRWKRRRQLRCRSTRSTRKPAMPSAMRRRRPRGQRLRTLRPQPTLRICTTTRWLTHQLPRAGSLRLRCRLRLGSPKRTPTAARPRC
ncbi:ribonuclease E/G-like protein [Arthrobacter sp. Hiyo4]|nr:ribonuclease E/G-like protein [Arthrobacter sp. Hiyo4]